jgi:hypothetical protein
MRHQHIVPEIGAVQEPAPLGETTTCMPRRCPADHAVTAAAARLKLDYGLPYADCFAAATAGRTGVLVTADPDFARISWLRVLAPPRHPGGPVKRATR